MATFERHVSVDWQGSVMEGKGEAKAGTGAFSLPVTFPSRIGESGGKTSPEELMAAAHAACYAMALNGTLGRKSASADRTLVTATITADKGDAGIKIMSSALTVTAYGLKGADAAQFVGDRQGSRGPVPGVERLPRHDVDHGRRQGRVGNCRMAGLQNCRKGGRRSPIASAACRLILVGRLLDPAGPACNFGNRAIVDPPGGFPVPLAFGCRRWCSRRGPATVPTHLVPQ